ncbi:MAG: cytochrome c biogenesis protein CcdA [Candidatus Aminicenantes bacterium]|nr:cytochrome c biogenesis protein CcdA [Candidatus Aminicenantes bacterium]
MPFAENVSIFAAFLGGLLSFLSPCCLPIIPSYLAFITGISTADLSAPGIQRHRLRRIIFYSFLFILGFSFIFIILGGLATFMGRFLAENVRWLELIGGGFIIILGFHVMGVFRLKFLAQEMRIHTRASLSGKLGTIIIGVAFGAGWIPCLAPMLGGILTLAAIKQNFIEGATIMGFYSLGFGLPFMVAGVVFLKYLGQAKSMKKYSKPISIIRGIFLIIVGLLLFSGVLSSISNSMAGHN